MKNAQPGKILKTLLGVDMRTFIQINFISQGYRTRAKEKENRFRNSLTDVKALLKKIVCKSDDPLAQRVHQEVTERMLLSSFSSGIFGKPGTQVRYACPQTLNEALRIALRVQEAEKQERFNETFYTKFDE